MAEIQNTGAQKSTRETVVSSKASVKDTKGRRRPKPYDRFDQVVRAVYEGAFKRAALSKKELVALGKSPFPKDPTRSDLLQLAKSDRLLDKTRRLMLLGVQIDQPDFSKELKALRIFAREVLQDHPLFRTRSLQDVLFNRPHAPRHDQAINAIYSKDCGALKWPDNAKSLTKQQCEQCRTNGVYCLLLLFWGERGTSLGSIHHLLQTNLWSKGARQPKKDAEKLRTLLCTRDPAAASVVYGLLKGVLDREERRAETAERGEMRLSEQLASTRGDVAALEKELEKTRMENKEIQAARQQEQHFHAATVSHWKDDYEQLRGQVLRKLNDELALLDEGLHALRRDPPKIHVMIDHAERAIDGLKREAEKLRRKN